MRQGIATCGRHTTAGRRWQRAGFGDGPRLDPTWSFNRRSTWCCSTARRRHARWCWRLSMACSRTASRKRTAGSSRGQTSTSRRMRICPEGTPLPTSCSGPLIAGPPTGSICCHSWMQVRRRLRISVPTNSDTLKLRDEWGKQVVSAAGAPSTTGVVETAAQSTSGSTETFAWQVSGDTKYLDRLYSAQLEAESDREWINTEGSLWIDRVTDSAGPMFVNTELQRARFGGVALIRNHIYPGNAVSWRFVAPAKADSIGILIPEATTEHLKIIVYNLDAVPVKAQITGWEVDPGQWEITQGVQTSKDAELTGAKKWTSEFERSRSLDLTFAPRTTTVIEMNLVSKGVPYWSRPDLGISADDVKVEGNRMRVTVHSLGSVDAPASKVVLRDRTGKLLAT